MGRGMAACDRQPGVSPCPSVAGTELDLQTWLLGPAVAFVHSWPCPGPGPQEVRVSSPPPGLAGAEKGQHSRARGQPMGSTTSKRRHCQLLPLHLE